MTAFLRSTLELMILLPGTVLAYLPMKRYLKLPPRRMAALTVPFTLLLCLAGGSLSSLFSLSPRLLLFPLAAIAGTAYVRSLEITLWKSVSVFLAVYGAFSCLGGVASALDCVINTDRTAPSLSLIAGGAWLGICCAFVLLSWYPATHAARELLEDEGFAQTWYVFWILPVLFIGLNFFLVPVNPELIGSGRLFPIYIVVSLALLFLLCLFYALFYLMASSLNRNDRLRQENQFLAMQQTRYDSLKTAIAETRQARHDMRHHFDILQNLAAKNDWDTLTRYLADARGEIPDIDLHLCDNTAVDSVAGHYGLLCRKAQIPFSFGLDLPAELPIPEIDLCLVLSNLLENALEASLRTAPERRQVTAQAYMHSEHIILLTVENSFDGKIEEKENVFQSSKRKGEGVGIQSVRRIVDNYGGYSRFSHENGLFRAHIMLRVVTNALPPKAPDKTAKQTQPWKSGDCG